MIMLMGIGLTGGARRFMAWNAWTTRRGRALMPPGRAPVAMRAARGRKNHMLNLSSRFMLSATFAAATALAAHTASAQIVFSDVAKSQEFQEDASGTVVPLGGGVNAFFYARDFYENPSDFDGGSVTYPGDPSPQIYNISGLLDCCGHNGRGYQTGYETPSDLDAAFPSNTTYTLTATNSVTMASQSVDIAFGPDIYAASTPTLTAASVQGLGSASAVDGLTIDFNNFGLVPGANVAQDFFTIYDYTTASEVFNYMPGFNSGTTSLVIPAGVLSAGDQYVFELIFDSADYANGGGDQDAGVAYRSDLRTLGYFTVPGQAVPEPATWAMLLMGFGGVGGVYRGARRKHGVVGAA
jgi:hypothetical protein